MQRLKSLSGVDLCVVQSSQRGVAEIRVAPCEPTEAVMHWGAIAGSAKGWRQPAPEAWPPGSEPFDRKAVRTPLAGHGENDPVVIRLDERKGFSGIEFVLHHPAVNTWDDNQGRNYHLDLPPSRFNRSTIQVARELAGPNGSAGELLTPLADEGILAVVTARGKAGGARIALVTDRPGPLLLHWGIALDRHQRWSAPPASMQPAKTKVVSDVAARTPFVVDEGYQSLVLDFADCSDVIGLSFVLYDEAEQRWFKQRGGDFFLRLSETPTGALPLAHTALAETIIDREMGSGSWTLMHRFNLAHDLLQGLVEGDRDGIALIYVWIRYSALRQLDWQRNYNTQPRELSHAEDRLTRLLARRYATDEASRRAIRWILPTLGRGGDGQKVRDEILQIMHRHRVKEVTGHFLEEWHQKLHNNTTPDDVVICEAYLAFLRSEGDRRAFYDTLEAGGVTRARMRNFERPIRTDPDFAPHLRDGLIHDFEGFLRILKSVHDGVDLESALRVAEPSLEPDLRADAWWVWKHRKSDDILAIARTVTRVRERLSLLLRKDEKETRDRLSLDVALEDFFRVALERNAQVIVDHRALAWMVPLVLRNLSLSWSGGEELAACIRQWDRLAEVEPIDALWALRSHAALDRTARALASDIDQTYELLQPVAEYLGRAFEAEPWTIQLFSEEVVRGRLEFVVGMLLRRFDAALRRIAGMPGCHVVSRGVGEARGRVLVTANLRTLQGQALVEPVVVVADHVAGDEELPSLVSAVLTRDAVDLVSHVAVRARNTGLVMVTVHDPAQYDGFRALRDASVGLRVTPSGDVVRDDAVRAHGVVSQVSLKPRTKVVVAPLSLIGVPLSDVDATLGGGKSNQLRMLRKNVEPGIQVPQSVVIPFSVFPHVVGHAVNAAVKKRYLRAVEAVRDAAEGEVRSASKRARDEVLALAPPEGLMKALKQVAARYGLRWPADDGDAWRCIKQVWASKWNERAVLNRRTSGMPDDELHMAVLVQEVADAEYSYVLHTVHPNAGDSDIGYGEVVVGLGEVLVGNHPGRPMGFSWSKRTGHVRITSMPSKRISLLGGGLMFRSDSSGEDLEGQAGAGLYDTVQLPAPRENLVDYASEPLVWDDAFRTEILETLGRIGQTLEQALGGAQDVEGTYSQGDYVVVQSRPQAGAEA